ncbi:MAG: glycosyltransferase family 2 protein [Candidatus Omnitrophica bacterium]|nr:glycosyltransferase family 2 protein [Candidatus Omnitrophota bacterium]
MARQPDLTVVVPVFNESALFAELHARVSAALAKTGRPAEIIYVDDGSSDGTLDLIRAVAARDAGVRFLSFSRNFGHQTAVSAGIENASGRLVLVMDGDLQDPPELIPEFLKLHEAGAEVVYAVRRKRKEGALLKFCYRLFYRFLAGVSDIRIPRDSGDFCLMDERVVRVLKRMPERRRFVRGIRAWAGFRQVPLEYERDRRFAGEAKYNLARLVRLAIDGISDFSDFPLRLCAYLGYAMAGVSMAGLLYSVASKLIYDRTPQGWTSTTIAIFFIGGVQLVMLSVVGGYVGRIYTEVKQRPLYVVKESNFELSGPNAL